MTHVISEYFLHLSFGNIFYNACSVRLCNCTQLLATACDFSSYSISSAAAPPSQPLLLLHFLLLHLSLFCYCCCSFANTSSSSSTAAAPLPAPPPLLLLHPFPLLLLLFPFLPMMTNTLQITLKPPGLETNLRTLEVCGLCNRLCHRHPPTSF